MDFGGVPIPADWVAQAGPVGLLAIAVLLVLTGRLVPRRAVKDLEQDRDYWREAALKAQGHTDVLLPAAEITTAVARALSDASSNRTVRAPEASGRTP